MSPVCECCLSGDRLLSRIQPALRDFLEVVLNQIPTSKMVNVCWECTALLKKVIQFKQRATRAQEWLQSNNNGEMLDNIPSLSSLQSNIPTSSQINLSPENEDCIFQKDSHKNEITDPFVTFVEVTCTDESDTFDDISSVKVEHDFINTEEELNIKETEMTNEDNSDYNNKHLETNMLDLDRNTKKQIKKKRKKVYKENYIQLKQETDLDTEIMKKIKHKHSQKKNEKRNVIKDKKKSLNQMKPLLQCPDCDQKFAYQCNLTDHSRIHTREKPHICVQCGKTYTQTASLNRHIRSHAGDRRYKCSYCNQSFLERKSLTDHCNIHTGERPHLCSMCGKRFTQRAALRTHLKIHEANKCTNCSVSFMSKLQMKQHKCQ